MSTWVVISGATIFGAAACYCRKFKATGFLLAFAIGFAAMGLWQRYH